MEARHRRPSLRPRVRVDEDSRNGEACDEGRCYRGACIPRPDAGSTNADGGADSGDAGADPSLPDASSADTDGGASSTEPTDAAAKTWARRTPTGRTQPRRRCSPRFGGREFRRRVRRGRWRERGRG